MKTRSVLVAAILAMFIGTTSTPSVFAQKFKYKPLPKGKKAVTVPYVVNPGFSRALRENITRWSGVEMVRPNAAGGVARQVSASTVNPSSLLPAVERTVAARVSQAAARTELRSSALSLPGSAVLPTGMTTSTLGLETPSSRVVKMPDVSAHVTAGVAAEPLTLEFLTSLEALEKYHPQWKSELRSAGFDEKQILEIEQAFVQTEKELFEVDDTGIWIRPLSREWDYKTKLVWYGEMSRKDFRTDQKVYIFEKFDDVFTHLNYQGFVLIHGRAPGEATQLGKKVANLINKTGVPIKLASEQVYEETLEHLRKTGKLPSISSPVSAERALRRKFDRMVKKEDWVDPFILRLKELQTLFGRSDRLGITDHD